MLCFTAKNPVPIKCPVAGKFRFEQRGEIPFTTQVIGGVTQAPRSNFYCKQKISDMSVCGEQKTIEIDSEYCTDVDHRGNPVDHQSIPDYRMDCVGYWREDLKSFMITYDKTDAFSIFRCWIYQRADLNRVFMSMSVGTFCLQKQNVHSYNSSEGAQVALDMYEYERERKYSLFKGLTFMCLHKILLFVSSLDDNCPMQFDDGEDPESRRYYEERYGYVRK